MEQPSSQPESVEGTHPSGVSKDERTWGMLCHLASFAGLVAPYLGNILGPLVVWLLQKEGNPFVDDQGKEALNFQITMTIGFLVCTALFIVLIGFPLMIALFIFDVVVVIMGAIKANEGERYRYPFNLRLIK